MQRDSLKDVPWLEILELLRNRQLPDSQVAQAIVRLGKPFNEKRIASAKEVVASYLGHPDSWVRREVMWFLGSWGRLREYSPVIIQAMKSDPFEDNRAFAASCLAVLENGTKHAVTLRALANTVQISNEGSHVRLEAYGALLKVFYGDKASDISYAFRMGDKKISDIDWELLQSIVPE